MLLKCNFIEIILCNFIEIRYCILVENVIKSLRY